jgi:hypothetical protein
MSRRAGRAASAAVLAGQIAGLLALAPAPAALADTTSKPQVPEAAARAAPSTSAAAAASAPASAASAGARTVSAPLVSRPRAATPFARPFTLGRHLPDGPCPHCDPR